MKKNRATGLISNDERLLVFIKDAAVGYLDKNPTNKDENNKKGIRSIKGENLNSSKLVIGQQMKSKRQSGNGLPKDSKNINIPFEVTTYIKGKHKRVYDMTIKSLIKKGISEQKAATIIAQKIAEALQLELACILKANGVKSTIIDVVQGNGGFTNPDSGKYDISPNINIKLDGSTSDDDIRSIMVVLNRAADQLAAIAFRNPTNDDISNDSKDIHHMLVFETPKSITETNFKRMILELNRFVDENGKPFITGHTNFGEFIGISGQFYEGNFEDQILLNLTGIRSIFKKYGVNLCSSKVIKQKVFSYDRSKENSQGENCNGRQNKRNTKSILTVQQEGGKLLQDTCNLFKRVFKEIAEGEINFDFVKSNTVKSKQQNKIGFFKSVA